jgi:hypothetical protein
MPRLKTGTRIFAIASILGVLIWLAWMNIVPSGVYKVVWKPDRFSPRIGPLVPESRVGAVQTAADGTAYRAVNNEPVNFDVKIPRDFDSAEVTVKYSGNPKIFEIGGLASRETWTNEMRPAENAAIDGLKWTRLAENGLVLYERRPDFKTVSDFISRRPSVGVATYHASGFPEATPENYSASEIVQEYKVAFRGATTIKTYLKNEKLNFLFKTQDVNRNAGADGFEATATLAGKPIARAVLADDGNASGDGKFSIIRDLRLYTDAPFTGVVTINLPAPDDIVFRETATPQLKFVFANRIYLADHVGYLTKPAAVLVFTTAKRVSATTAHAEAFQTLKIGKSDLVINDVNTPFSALTGNVPGGITAIVSPYGDARLETAGYFVLTPDNYWPPDPPALTADMNLEADGINYILTSYVPPLHAGDWRVADTTFDLKDLSALDRTYNFTLSLPGKTAAEALNVAEIDVVFRRPPLSWNDLAALWNKIVGIFVVKVVEVHKS